jgi:translation initiation factor IF-3
MLASFSPAEDCTASTTTPAEAYVLPVLREVDFEWRSASRITASWSGTGIYPRGVIEISLHYLPCYNFLFPVAHRAEDRIDKRFIRTNDRIRAREIRVIGDEGEQIGVMPPFEALKLAKSKNLDLVEISPTAQPPVCRIMDYGKYLYQQEKKEREAKKHQKTITVKEVKFRINVDDHDYATKKNHVLRFLDGGDKVKATIFFRGREMTRTGLGRQILERLIKDVEPHSIVEFRPRQEGNTLHAILAPKKTAAEREKEREREAKQKAKAEKKLAQENDKSAEKPAAEGDKQPVAAGAEVPNPVSQA